MSSRSTCSKAGCERETSRAYCTKHRCTHDGCDSPRRRHSTLCAAHVPCTKVGCEEPRYFADDIAAANSFCDEHFYTCRHSDCDSPETVHPVDAEQRTPGYCTNHRCNAPECSSPPDPTAGGVLYCRDHSCSIPECQGTIAGGSSRQNGYFFCSDHTCVFGNCPGKRRKGRTLCSQHSCAASGCQELGADSAAGRPCCETHGCLLPGCPQPSQSVSNKSTSPYCAAHACRAPGCDNSRDLYPDRPFCESHESCGKKGCDIIKHPSERFCADHQDTCSRLDCFDRRKYHQIQHWYIYSSNIFRDKWTWRWVDGKPYACCREHTCDASECFAEQEVGRRCCEGHDVCSKNHCEKSVQKGVALCADHATMCLLPDCWESRLGDSQPYCSQHGCAASGCWRARQSQSQFCEHHIPCGTPGCTNTCTLPDRACGDDHRCWRPFCFEPICSTETKYCLADVCSREGCNDARKSVFDNKASHAFCANHKPRRDPRSGKTHGRSKHNTGHEVAEGGDLPDGVWAPDDGTAETAVDAEHEYIQRYDPSADMDNLYIADDG